MLDQSSTHRVDLLILWLVLALSALTGLCARLAQRLYSVGELPPSEAELLETWRRRRLWVLISEISALPMFATAWVAASLQWSLPIPLVVLGSMASGALGFGFLLHALQTWVLRKAAQ